MKTDKFADLQIGDRYDEGEYDKALCDDMQTIKMCLKFLLNRYERAEGEPGALIVNSLIDKLEEK